jgi:sugar-specific transcriptional regulator TrmB
MQRKEKVVKIVDCDAFYEQLKKELKKMCREYENQGKKLNQSTMPTEAPVAKKVLSQKVGVVRAIKNRVSVTTKITDKV